MDSRIRIQNLLNGEGDTNESSFARHVVNTKRTSPISVEELEQQSPEQDSEIDPPSKKVNRAKKEQQRRSRMNQFFDELKTLLPKDKDKLEVSRITKEDVLEKSVEYIEHLRNEIRNLKRRRGVGDPSSIIGMSQNEIDAGFNVLYPLEYAKFSSIYDSNQLSHINMSIYRLKELSDKSSRDEHRLATYFMHHMLIAAYQFNPVQMVDVITTTLNIYSKIKKSPEGSEPYFMYFRTDLKVVCLCNMSVAMAHMGRYDESDKYIAKAMKYVDKLNHRPSKNMLHLFTRQLYCIRGDPLPKSIGLEIFSALRDDPLWSNHGPLYYYTSLLENGETDDKLIDQIADYVEKISRLYGSMSQGTMSGLYAYMLSKTNKALSLEYITNEIEKYRKFNISSTFCLPEFLRLKASIMMDLDPDLQKRDEIESYLKEARQTAEALNWKNCELKILIQMVKFYQRLHDKQNEENSIKELTNSLYHIKLHSTKDPPSSVLEAQQLVNK